MTHPGRPVAERIGHVGVWTAALDRMTSADARDAARRIEAMGAGALWIAEGGAMSKDIFAHLALLLTWTDRIPVASGIANIWARDAVAMQNGARALADAFPGRLVLGLGISHAPVVQQRTGATYDRPVARMREYLDAMDRSPYAAAEPPQPAPRVLAALGPQMLRLAAERTAGAHPYFVPIEHTSNARGMLGEGPLLAVEQAVAFDEDPVRARELARSHMASYLRRDNYANNLRRLGWSDEEIAGPSDRLVDAIVAWGPLESIAGRIRAHLRNGADHVCVQPLSMDARRIPLDRTEELLRAVA